ncbi:MAG: hypothetical protein IPN38_09310 [Flavobacteriales bacterium]|nr:hypothetical protein [Flavobacteriales bacterium]
MSDRPTYRTLPITVVVVLIELLVWALGIVAWYILDRHVPAFRLERSWVLWVLPPVR